jgi:CHAT domain-containing protein/tetratricopeptide (TPR) repeat protein
MRASFGSFASVLLLTIASFISAHSQDNNPAAAIEPGKAIERELTSGERHDYRITLAAGEFAQVVVEQRGIDIIVSLFTADGEKVTERIMPGRYGRLYLSTIARTPASYRIEARGSNTATTAGSYEIKMIERRPSLEQDQDRIAAEQAAAEGLRLAPKGDAESTRQAREKFETAQALWQKLGDRYGQGVALYGLGQTWQPQYQFQKAFEGYNQAIAHFHAAGARREAAVMRNLAGRALVAMREIQRGIDYFLETRQFWLATKDRAGEADALYSLGFAYGRLYDYQKALAYYEEALPLHRALGNRRQEAQTLNNIGTIYAQQNNYRKAISYFQQAQEIWQGQQNTLSVINVLINLGVAYAGLNEYLKAIEYYQQALAGWRSVKNRMGEAVALNNLSESFYKLGKRTEAREHASQALAISLAIGDRRVQTESRYTIAMVARDLGDFKEGRRQIEQLLADVETDRATVVSQEARASWFANYRPYYDFYLDLMMRGREDGYEAAALEVSERFRARSMLEILKESGAELRQAIDPALAARELALRQKIENASAAQRKSAGSQGAAEQKDQLQRELTLLTAEYDQLQAEIKSRHPQYAALTRPQPLSLAEIQRQVLDENTLLLEYALGEENSYLFAVTQATINAFTLPKRSEIERAAKRLYQRAAALGNPMVFHTAAEKQAWLDKSQRDYRTAAETLSRMLLDPAKHMLGTKRLLIIGDGILHYVPFSALPRPENGRERKRETRRQGDKANPQPASLQIGRNPQSFTPLIVDHEILSLPSASTLAALRSEIGRREPAPKMIAIFADPVFDRGDERVKAGLTQTKAAVERNTTLTQNERELLRRSVADFSDEPGDQANGQWMTRLPSTRLEALAIQALAPESERLVALDFDASLAVVTSADLYSYRYIHFATHGLLNNDHAELSGLVFSMVDRSGREQNGFLRTIDVPNLKLAADLVVLSGCRTGLGKEVSGEGIVGLTRAFLYAGAKRVVASLWQVNDAATAELMKRFYREMLGEKRLSPAAALRAAQLAMWRSGRWRAPYYWAGFALQGEW